MSRLVGDCRRGPWRTHCTLTFIGEEWELLPALEAHCVREHGQKRGAALRQMLRSNLIDEREYLELEGVPLEAPAA